jgi:hypothetical protein
VKTSIADPGGLAAVSRRKTEGEGEGRGMRTGLFRSGIALLLASGLCTRAETQALDRRAVVTDTSGVSTELAEVAAASPTPGWQGVELLRHLTYRTRGGHLVVYTKPFVLGIELRQVRSLRATGKRFEFTELFQFEPMTVVSQSSRGREFEVRYVWQGRDTVISAALAEGIITGKSDLGDFSLPTMQLRALTFRTPPSSGAGESVPGPRAFDTVLILTDGTRVPVADLRRFTSYFSSKGYVSGGEMVRATARNLAVVRGESHTVVSFDNITTIESGRRDSVRVALKNGSTGTGTLPESGEWAMPAFAGLCERGRFLLSREQVRSVQFDVHPGEARRN